MRLKEKGKSSGKTISLALAKISSVMRRVLLQKNWKLKNKLRSPFWRERKRRACGNGERATLKTFLGNSKNLTILTDRLRRPCTRPRSSSRCHTGLTSWPRSMLSHSAQSGPCRRGWPQRSFFEKKFSVMVRLLARRSRHWRGLQRPATWQNDGGNVLLVVQLFISSENGNLRAGTEI